MIYNANMNQYGVQRIPKNQTMQNVGAKVMQQRAPLFQKNNGYQLKVGGVVVGSWANNTRNLQAARVNRPGMVKNSRFSSNFKLVFYLRFATPSTNEFLVQ